MELKQAHDKKYKYVLFDIFDTIVKRVVFPENTKRIWANHITKTLPGNYTMMDLYKTRSELEIELGAKNNQEGHDYEFTYKELVNALYAKYDFQTSEEAFFTLLENYEIDIESSVQVPDEEVIEEIKKLRKEGKKIYCVSDMYLSKSMLAEIFKRHGILELFDDIFVSCEYLKNKKSGQLYDVVLKNLKAKPSECIMIGDNKYSDYESSKNRNIDAIHLDREARHAEYQKKHAECTEKEKNIIKNVTELSKKQSDNFEHLIFSLYLFTERLYFKLLSTGRNEVFFLSREGEFLKKLFDAYVEKVHGKKIKSHYLLVSRKATYLPSLKPLKEENFDYLLKQYKYTSIEELLKSLNLPDEGIKKIENSLAKENKKLKIDDCKYNIK